MFLNVVVVGWGGEQSVETIKDANDSDARRTTIAGGKQNLWNGGKLRQARLSLHTCGFRVISGAQQIHILLSKIILAFFSDIPNPRMRKANCI